MQSVEYHMNICKDCREKYLKLLNILDNYKTIKNKILSDDADDILNYKNKQYKLFMDNLSAYVDNELDNDNNLKIKKIAIANSDARKELENILSFRQLLKDAFEKTKNSLKKDYSEETVNSLFRTDSTVKTAPYNPYIVLVSGTITTIFLVILISIFY